MKKEKNTVDFDISVLSLSELINLYEKIYNFNEYLNEIKIAVETKEGAK